MAQAGSSTILPYFSKTKLTPQRICLSSAESEQRPKQAERILRELSQGGTSSPRIEFESVRVSEGGLLERPQLSCESRIVYKRSHFCFRLFGLFLITACNQKSQAEKYRQHD